MKRFASICFILLLAGLFVAQSNDAMAQTIKIKKVGRSLNQLPAGSAWHISNALRVVGKGSKVYLEVDTLESGVTGTPAWSFVGSLPAGSAATLDSSNTMMITYTADTTGFYYVSVSMGGQTAYDTVYASTYTGIDTTSAQAGCFCHASAAGIKSTWQNTGHAKIFREGVSGELETIPELGVGLYAKGCPQCHTTGFDATLNNNNFGYLAHTLPAPSPASWDSTWFLGLPWTADGRDVMIKTGTDSIWAKVPNQAKPLATIGCESCHGPSSGHKNGGGGTGNFRQTIGKSLDQAVCNQCHNASRKHSLGKYFNMSKHALVPNGEHTHQYGCTPCHVGGLFADYAATKDTTGFAAKLPTAPSGITCAVCHDPHGATDLVNNPDFLRTESVGKLMNGYVVPEGLAGAGQLCGNCHKARYDVNKRVTNVAPYYGFVNRFGPHNSPQFDMLIGQSGYQYGDTTISNLNTHANLPDGCVTCHMQDRPNGLANHEFSMEDTTDGFKAVTVCTNCHGQINDFNDIQAAYDYDGNGAVEGVQTEIQGMLNKLKTVLPLDANGEPVTSTADSLKVKNHPEFVQAIWNYYFVKNDWSMGVHNAKYAVALLQKSFKSLGITYVKPLAGEMPQQYALSQNFPNPFNPSTNIRFALPNKESVKLEVYDILGNLVTTLVDQEMGAGNYNVTWNGVDKKGARVASGMYLYKLQAGTFMSVKKMLLVK